MVQKLVILRGSSCSGKTTIAEKIRDYDKKIAWLSVDTIKPIFSDFKDATLDEAHRTVSVVLKDLLERNFSVIVDGIFKKPEHLDDLLRTTKEKNIPAVIYQLDCSLETLKNRDRNRDGVKHGLWAPLGDELIESLYNSVQENPIEGAIYINTEAMTFVECIEIIKSTFEDNKS